MTNSERGAYEPRGETIRAFDPNEDEDVDQDDVSRLPLLVAIALVVLTAFAGVVWLAYSQGVERGRADAPRVIVAKSVPENVSPPPYTGLKIYQPSAPAGQETGNAYTAPVPPAPTAAAGKSKPDVTPTNSAPALRPSANTTTDSSIGAPQSRTASAPQSAPPVAHSAAVLEKPAPAPAPAAPRTATRPPTKIEAPSTTVASVSPAAAPTAAPASQVSPNGVLVQIGSYKSDAEARAAWTAFQANHPVTAGYQPDVKEVDLGPKGVWYRLRITGFTDKDSASALCQKLKANGASCLIAR